MDLHFEDEMAELQRLAGVILANYGDRQRAAADGGDRALWQELASAGIVAAVLPDDAGGMGFGVEAVAVVAEAQGRHVAPVPLWTDMVAARAVAAAGLLELAESAASGDVVLTVALEEANWRPLDEPATTASRAGGGWALDGEKVMVPGFETARRAVVSATGPDGPGIFLVDLDSDGVVAETMIATDYDEVALLRFSNAPAQALGGAEALRTLLREARIALAAVLIGVARGALRLSAEYTAARHQFGRPIGSFQAVQHQLADCWIAINAAELALSQAIADHDSPDPAVADRSADVADWWARRAGADTVYRAQHVHGGVGVDIGYPLHRYFLWGRRLSLVLGGAEQTLERLGADLARTGASS